MNGRVPSNVIRFQKRDYFAGHYDFGAYCREVERVERGYRRFAIALSLLVLAGAIGFCIWRAYG